MLSAKRQPDGTTLILHAGVHYTVPKEIDVLNEKHEDFIGFVKDYVEDQTRCIVGDLQLINMGNWVLKVGIYQRRDHLFIIFLEDTHTGWAEFKTRPDGNLEEVLAAVASIRQRKGLYTALLKHLKKYYRRIILSSSALTISNALRWMKTGTFNKKYRRYQVNPKPTLKAVGLALTALATRTATGTEYLMHRKMV
jgi:GNAT superfamily N-acetyltransferase